MHTQKIGNLFSRNSKKSKKGQVEHTAGPAAVLVAVIGLAIVLYIILVPPDVRRTILEEGTLPGDTVIKTPTDERVDSGLNRSLLDVNIGDVSYVKQEEVLHTLPSVYLYTKTEGSVIEEVTSLYVKSSIFSAESKKMSFKIEDLDNTENVLLNFLVKSHEGRLMIKLNDYEVYNREITTPNIEPIILNKDLLKNENVLEFTVESPGYAFWSVNEYELEKIVVVGDVTDVSKSRSTSQFYIEMDEYKNAEKARLEIYPDCNIRTVGKLRLSMNGNVIKDAVPDCNYVNRMEFPVQYLNSGINYLDLFAESGTYYVDQIRLRVDLEETKDYIYYFELDEDYFYKVGDKEPICGEVDSVCPDNCDEDEDKDCCFEASRDNFWCDNEPAELDDRCVSYVGTGRCDRCASGYEDYDGEPVEACKRLCGDDADGICPLGCGIYYDKDCCFERATYWCEDVPLTGLESTCEEGVDREECDDCSDGYEDKDGKKVSCPAAEDEEDFRYELRKKYDVELKIKFVNGNEKEGDILVNNHLIRFATDDEEYKRDISNLVEEGHNSIKLMPKSSMHIRSLSVSID